MSKLAWALLVAAAMCAGCLRLTATDGRAFSNDTEAARASAARSIDPAAGRHAKMG